MTRALILLALLSGCSAPIHRNTGAGVGIVLGGETRKPCDPPRISINNVCTTEKEWNRG